MNYSEEEKETIAHLIDMSNLSLIGDGTVIIQNETIAIVLNLIQKQDKIINDIKLITYNNKPHITQEKIIEYFKKVVDEDVKD